jgi:hypothetical protein
MVGHHLAVTTSGPSDARLLTNAAFSVQVAQEATCRVLAMCPTPLQIHAEYLRIIDLDTPALCRYLGQLLDDAQKADAAYCTGIEILQRNIEALVCFVVSGPEAHAA